jgi:hypothetical protein
MYIATEREPVMTPALLMMIAVGTTAGLGGSAPGARPPSDLIDVHDPDEVGRWIRVHDTVMGGRSAGDLRSGASGLVFTGEVSLQNNGGFASVRTGPRDFGLAGAEGLLVRVRGDGRTYRLRLRLDDQFDGIAYSADLATEAGVWTDVRVPFAAFVPVWRGRQLDGPEPVAPARIRQLGFMIADKAAGPFRLEIGRVAAY